MKKAEFSVIHAPAYMDKFMKAADLFHHKNLGVTERVIIIYNEDTDLTLKHAGQTITHLKETYERLNHVVSFIHLAYIQCGNKIIINDEIKPFYDKKAREISDGHKSFLFWQFIDNATPFKCKISQNCFIEEIL